MQFLPPVPWLSEGLRKGLRASQASGVRRAGWMDGLPETPSLELHGQLMSTGSMVVGHGNRKNFLDQELAEVTPTLQVLRRKL